MPPDISMIGAVLTGVFVVLLLVTPRDHRALPGVAAVLAATATLITAVAGSLHSA